MFSLNSSTRSNGVKLARRFSVSRPISSLPMDRQRCCESAGEHDFGLVVADDKLIERFDGSLDDFRFIKGHGVIGLSGESFPESLERSGLEEPGAGELVFRVAAFVFLAQRAARGGSAVDFLDLLLILRGEGLVGFVRHNGKEVGLFTFLHVLQVVNALPFLIAANAEAAAEFLPLLHVAVGFVKRGDVEDVGIVPADAERGVGEDEFARVGEVEQGFFVTEDFVEDFLVLQHGVLAVRVFLSAGLREVVALALVDLLRRGDSVVELAIERGVFLAKEDFDEALVTDVVVHLVDEDEGEALDALGGEDGLFLEVAADKPLELLAEEAGNVAVTLLESEFDRRW